MDQINDKDCFNELPDCLLSSILSLLTIKDAVNTSLVSRRWSDSVLTRSNLVFDLPNIFGSKYFEPGCKRLGYHLRLLRQFKRQDFVSRVNQFLHLYRGNKIDSFKVSFLFDGESTYTLNNWIRFAITKGVRVLDLELFLSTCNPYVFPCTILSELLSSSPSTLKHLSLSECVLRPPPDFNGFNQLTSLCLVRVTVDQTLISRLFSASLLLESLTLSSCEGLGTYLIIPGPLPRLKDVKVFGPANLRGIEIFAENLTSFEFAGYANLSFMKTLKIARAYLGARQDHTVTYALNQFSLSPRLESLHLHIGPCMEVPETIPTFRFLKKLDVDVYLKESEPDIGLRRVLNLLKATPILEELVITLWAVEVVELYQNQQEVRNLSGFTHDHLKKVRIQGCQGNWYEIEFALSILNNTMKLSSLIIDPLGTLCMGGKWIKLESQLGSCDFWGKQRKADIHEPSWEGDRRALVEGKLMEVKTNAKIIIL